MREARVLIQDQLGLHARAAVRVANEAVRHSCEVTIECDGRRVDGKRVVELLSLSVRPGQEIVIRTEGNGEETALTALVSVLVHSGLGRTSGVEGMRHP